MAKNRTYLLLAAAVAAGLAPCAAAGSAARNTVLATASGATRSQVAPLRLPASQRMALCISQAAAWDRT